MGQIIPSVIIGLLPFITTGVIVFFVVRYLGNLSDQIQRQNELLEEIKNAIEHRDNNN